MDYLSLSKILPLLIYPFALALWSMCLALLFLWRRRPRAAGACILAAILVMAVGGNPSFSHGLYARHEQAYLPRPLSEYPSADAIVVLGGGVNPPLPPRRHADLGSEGDRIWMGARLYQAGKAPLILLSGGNVFHQPGVESEAFYAAEILKQWGIPGSALLLEGRSRNTYENAVYSKEILDELGLRKVILVTSAMHMRRALAVFKSRGIESVPAPTDFQMVALSEPGPLRWIPTLGAMAALTTVIKENLGILMYRYRGWIRDEPEAS